MVSSSTDVSARSTPESGAAFEQTITLPIPREDYRIDRHLWCSEDPFVLLQNGGFRPATSQERTLVCVQFRASLAPVCAHWTDHRISPSGGQL